MPGMPGGRNSPGIAKRHHGFAQVEAHLSSGRGLFLDHRLPPEEKDLESPLPSRPDIMLT